jgi:hypothetical protein
MERNPQPRFPTSRVERAQSLLTQKWYRKDKERGMNEKRIL